MILLQIPYSAHYRTYSYACANPYFLIDFLSSCSFFSINLANRSRHLWPFKSTLLLSELNTPLRTVALSSQSSCVCGFLEATIGVRAGGARGAAAPPVAEIFGQNAGDSGKSTREKTL